MKVSAEETERIARTAFGEIANKFPSLKMVEEDIKHVEISIDVLPQDGLNHKVWLALQNHDELHFSVSHFWLEWFPCTNPIRVQNYIEAVCGFLSGEYRILEHFRGEKCVKAELQKPIPNGWETIGTWCTLHIPFLRKTFNEIRNSP